MGRRSTEEAENHWPGFVDALSTIVMVVTFLLIILSIAIFVLSQSIAKSYVESQSKITDRGGGDMWMDEKKDGSKDFQSSDESDNPNDKDTPPQSASSAASESKEESSQSKAAKKSAAKSTSKKKSASTVKAKLAEELTADQEIESDKNLAILSRKTKIDEDRIVVAAADKSEEIKKIRVLKSATILTLQFDKSSVKIDETSSDRVRDFVASKDTLNSDTKLTVWSFTGSKTNSVSEAKRIAYYRALTARNELLKNGFEQKNIAVEVRIGNSDDTYDTVQIVVKP